MINYKNLILYANNSDELIKKIEHLMNINTKINRIPNNLKFYLIIIWVIMMESHL